jgi:hypothetical protein
MEAGDEERPLLQLYLASINWNSTSYIINALFLSNILKFYNMQDGDSRHSRDETVDINGQPAAKTSTGNWRACFFVLGIEFSE